MLHGAEFQVDDQVIVQRGSSSRDGIKVQVAVLPDALHIFLPGENHGASGNSPRER
jgi:hypothetical protein